MGRRPSKAKEKSARKAPAGWTEEAWVAEQTSWKEDALGPLWWAMALQLKNEKGDPMEWEDRAFLVDILCDLHPRQVIVKCTQVGLSTIMIFKTHFMAQVYGYGVIYTMPTFKLLVEFTKTKTDRIVEHNPAVFPTGVSSDGEMSMGAHVYKGAGYVLSRGTMGDSQDISHSADIIVPDETDRSDLSVVEGLESRLMASSYKGQWWFTNPTRPKVGTDEKWQISDKREWHVTCPHCQTEQVLDYWQNVVRETWTDEDDRTRTRAYFACSSCNQEWDDDKTVRRSGRWIATNPDADLKWHGYHISQLCASWISAQDLVELEDNKDKEFFYNFVLGLPVIADGYSVERSVIMQNVVPEGDPRWQLKSTRKFMGVDVGKVLHVTILDEHGTRKLATLADDRGCTPKERADLKSTKGKWGKLRQLFVAEQIQTCVIDNLPSEKQADFQRMFPYKVWRCIYDYNDKRKADIVLDRKVGVVHAHKTRVIDTLVDEYSTQSRPLFLALDDPLLDGTGTKKTENCLSAHWEAFYVVGADGQDVNVVKKDRMGNVIRTWENAGPDHFGHADIYGKIAQVIGGGGSGSANSFVLGDFKSTPKGSGSDDSDDDDFPGDDEDEATFYNR